MGKSVVAFQGVIDHRDAPLLSTSADTRSSFLVSLRTDAHERAEASSRIPPEEVMDASPLVKI
jgi:hypothetical protein